MFILLSPAKTLDFETAPQTGISSVPFFSDNADYLVSELQKYSASGLEELMGISRDLAVLNFDRYRNWRKDIKNAITKQAVLTFNGEAYRGLKAAEMDEDDLLFAQEHLRILSGLYGVLRPLDLIQPYRLEMGIKLQSDGFKNLYQYWGDRITEYLNKFLSENDYVINLASNEYFKSVKPAKLNAKIITPVFKDFSRGEIKTITVYAKNARGAMTRHIIKNRITDPEGLKVSDVNGYEYDAMSSDDKVWTFVRG